MRNEKFYSRLKSAMYLMQKNYIECGDAKVLESLRANKLTRNGIKIIEAFDFSREFITDKDVQAIYDEVFPLTPHANKGRKPKAKKEEKALAPIATTPRPEDSRVASAYCMIANRGKDDSPLARFQTRELIAELRKRGLKGTLRLTCEIDV